MNEPSMRKPLGVLAILGWIALWAVLAVTLPRPDSQWLQILWFGALGVAWIAPLKPVLRWMEGKN